MSLDRAVADTRRAVRDALSDLPGTGGGDHTGRSDGPVLVACSGGADSLALLAAARYWASKTRWGVRGVCVDHQLQPGSSEHTRRVLAQMSQIGVDGSVAVDAEVTDTGAGLEADARAARYAALERVAETSQAAAVLLGHTADDQAETVLLGLARGSGARSLAGMPAVTGRYRRPLLGIPRADTERACRAQGIEFWSDPHNADPRFTRVRVRQTVLPSLEEQLGPGVSRNLVRTAEALRADTEALDEWAGRVHGQLGEQSGLRLTSLSELPTAVRTRVLRRAALDAGALPAELASVHIHELDHAVSAGRGGHTVQLPGHVTATVRAGRLTFCSTRT